MTELRRRMDDDMVARGMAVRTRETYLAAVTGLAKFYHRLPDQISDEEVQAYLRHLIQDRHRSERSRLRYRLASKIPCCPASNIPP